MKNIIYTLGVITILTTFSSCNLEEIQIYCDKEGISAIDPPRLPTKP